MKGEGKYGVSPAKKRTLDNVTFHSQREMLAYRGFRALLDSGGIKSLELQVPYVLYAAQAGAFNPELVPVGKLIVDFKVTELDGTVRIYESKGMATQTYKLKRKLFEACYPHLRLVEI